MGRLRRSRLPLAIVVAAVAAGAATLLLRPRGVIHPAPVDVRDYFTANQLDRAEDYRSVQRLIGAGSLLLTTGVLVLLAARPPRLLERIGRPILGGAAAGAGIALVVTVVGLPLAAWSHQRSVDVGLSTQNWGEWLSDVGKSTLLELVFAAVGGAVALGLVRRFRRHWWVPAAVVVVAVGAITTWLFPIVVDPLFNRFEPLPPGKTRTQVLRLAERAGVDVGQVYRVDASRRTTAANAYVNGLGHTKRVVLFDNLIDDGFDRHEVGLVVAHELGHEKHHDIYRGLAWLALVAPAGTLVVQRLAEALGRRQGLADPSVKPGAAALPAVLLAVALVSFCLGSASNYLSRQVEAAADTFSLRLTHEPAAFIRMQRQLALRNLSDPDPPKLWSVLFGTHPTTAERIGIGKAFEEGD